MSDMTPQELLLEKITRQVYHRECRCCGRNIRKPLVVADRNDDGPRCNKCAPKKGA